MKLPPFFYIVMVAILFYFSNVLNDRNVLYIVTKIIEKYYLQEPEYAINKNIYDIKFL